MNQNTKKQEVSLIDATSYAAKSADKLTDASEGVFNATMNLPSHQTSSVYAHGRSRAQSSSFRPPMELQNLNSENENSSYGNSNSLLNTRLEF